VRTIAAILLLLIAAASEAAPTTAKVARPTEAIGQAGCVRAECHADIRNYAVVHGPVGVNACDACHALTDAEAHTFRLTRAKSDLCTYCHDFDVSGMPVVHKPVAQGECLGCHDPHGGSTRQLIREASVADLCHRCHESITRGRSVLHTPVMKGACESCHPPHASRFPKLLDAVGPDLCLACHGDFEARMARATFTHKALESGCEKCHDVHGSNHAMATTQPIRQQCAGCHEPIMTVAANASIKHPAVSDERSCMNCHTPHGSALDKLVSDVPAKLCGNCHAKEIKTDRGTVVAAMPDLATRPDVHVHGALRDGRCAGCHAPHGAASADLLTKFYSTRFYQSFAPQKYELCFSCHDARLAQERATTTFTAFRNGQDNLHFVHVKLQGERGENCRVCHETHGGMGARGVRHRVRFGTWDMPIRFTRTDTGGTCFPGCHPLYGYDRARPVANEGAPRRAAPSVARAGPEKPASVELMATDRAGRAVRVPDPRRPSVLLVARSGQAESERAIKLLGATAPDARLADVVVILGGAGADKAAEAMNVSCPIVLDADGTIAAELAVHGWPTALVITSDGTEIARVGGTASALAVKLPAYVDLAAGRVDRRNAERRATTREVVGDQAVESHSSASRDLHEAERLIAAGRFAEARQILVRILPQAHDSARANYLMGRVLEHEQDWPGAARHYRAMRDATTRPSGGGP
jgi:predicted CXXCH cytochrome family protein